MKDGSCLSVKKKDGRASRASRVGTSARGHDCLCTPLRPDNARLTVPKKSSLRYWGMHVDDGTFGRTRMTNDDSLLTWCRYR